MLIFADVQTHCCVLLLPQLQVAIDQGHDDKVRSAFRPTNSGYCCLPGTCRLSQPMGC